MRSMLAIIITLSLSWGVSAGQYPEAYYQEQWCADRGETEHVLFDGTRVDCLTPTQAVEVDFARKWYEGITQALYYAMLTGKQPVLLLIIERPQDIKYYYRAERLIRRYELPVEVILTGGGL